MSTERLSDAQVNACISGALTHDMAYYERLIAAMARELRERRDTERAVAPAVENPYRFSLSVEPQSFGGWCVFLGDDTPSEHGTARDVLFVDEFDTEAKAREHAALIAAALRNVEVEQ